MGKGCDAGGGSGVGRSVGRGSGMDGGNVGRSVGRSMGGGRGSGMDGRSVGGSVGGSSALGTAHARSLAAADRTSGFVRLPDCSPAPYGSLLVAHLRLGTLMCWAVRVLSTLPQGRFFPWFSSIRAAVSGQLC